MLATNAGKLCVWLSAILIACCHVSMNETCVCAQRPHRVSPVPGAQNLPVVATVEAHAGRPYGIGKVTFRLRPGDEIITKTEATWFTEKNDRIHYPVISHTPVRKFLKILSGDTNTNPTDLLTIWFLFEGDEPLQAQIHGSDVVDFEIPVEFTRPRRYERFATNWWPEL